MARPEARISVGIPERVLVRVPMTKCPKHEYADRRSIVIDRDLFSLARSTIPDTSTSTRRLRLCCADAGCVRTPLAHDSSTLIYFESLIFQETTEELSILYMGFVRVRAYVANTTFNEL